MVNFNLQYLLIKNSNISLLAIKLLKLNQLPVLCAIFKDIAALTDLQYDTAVNGLLDNDAIHFAYSNHCAAAAAATAGTAKYVLLSVNDVPYVGKYDGGQALHWHMILLSIKNL